ncbi:FAH family protein [Devosia epidermidihirudinis]|uniref:FAH family protein n=1 Tax=Devosia epidermidihirudinis TaxID=1293439 RepID=A0A0F5QAW5_9HYPH|nr:AraD1 family protein [Devosia epidermidihirudinis]KKC38085.1 FAH family protein [Devosia epidermidihirudinis]
MRVIQFLDNHDQRRVGIVEASDSLVTPLEAVTTVYDLAQQAIATGQSLQAVIAAAAKSAAVDYDALLDNERVLTPVDHPEPARMLVTGTGLTHIGSAAARDQMHIAMHGEGGDVSDSLAIFRMGLEGGKPTDGGIGVQPEWFFKGVGSCVVPPGAPLPMPAFALAGAEEAEVVGLYINDQEGVPFRIGFAIGNEYSDHVTEGANYLYLAHSKLRACSIGPELLIGDLPEEVSGYSRIWRESEVLWEEPVLSGEAHMSHSIANLEHYHFRYSMFRRPGDLHAYFFGAAVMSYASGIEVKPGDEFEIDLPTFGRPLRNRVEPEADPGQVIVRQL